MFFQNNLTFIKSRTIIKLFMILIWWLNNNPGNCKELVLLEGDKSRHNLQLKGLRNAVFQKSVYGCAYSLKQLKIKKSVKLRNNL